MCPWKPDHPSNTDWIEICRKTFSNDDLLDSLEEQFSMLVKREKPEVIENLGADPPGAFQYRERVVELSTVCPFLIFKESCIFQEFY